MFDVKEFRDGIIIKGVFPSGDVMTIIKQRCPEYKLVIADPPYGNIVSAKWDIKDDDKKHAQWMIDWTHVLQDICFPGAALYVWGGYGKPLFRPFYRYLVDVEHQTDWRLANHITWSKKRAYGFKHNYLCTREECAYLVHGDIKKPLLFNVPYLDKKRGYSGYNLKYPAKSEYLRRTSVWTDITEIFSGKRHETQKQVKLMEIPILTHTCEKDTVLDPFAGSGTTAIAAINTGRKFVLVEEDKESFDIAVSIVQEAYDCVT